MTVYVTPLAPVNPTPRWKYTRAAYLAADSPEELAAFAARLGLRPEWLQSAGTWREHYDLSPVPHGRALALGVTLVERKELARWMIAKRDRRST